MIRNCASRLGLFSRSQASLAMCLGQPTPINRLGDRRRGGGGSGNNSQILDDSEFMGRSNTARAPRGGAPSSTNFGLEGEGADDNSDDFASFVAARNKHLGVEDEAMMGRRAGSQKRQQKPNGEQDAASPSSSSSTSPPTFVSPASFRGKGKRITINAGGELFQTVEGTLLQYPQTPFGQMILEEITNFTKGDQEAYENLGNASSASSPKTNSGIEIFLDVDPKVFNSILQFLRSGKMVLPTDDEPLRFAISSALKDFGLLDVAFPPIRSDILNGEGGENGGGDEEAEPVPMVRLPDVCVIQMCDHLQHDQGVKRHALNISYGSDGFMVRDLCKKIRKDLNGQLSNTYWQCYQTHERSMFLITTKIANGTADLMMASVTQRLIEHTEATMGYRLVSSYVTLSPDIKNTNVRLFIHNLIFRRVRNPALEDTDAVQLFSNPDGSISAAMMGAVSGLQHQEKMRQREDETFVPNEEMYRNFETPAVGPQSSYDNLGMPLTPPSGQRVQGNIWEE